MENESIQQLLENEVPFGLLADLVGFSTGAGCHQLQEVLETTNLETRGRKVLELMQSCLDQDRESSGDFPPKFSQN